MAAALGSVLCLAATLSLLVPAFATQEVGPPNLCTLAVCGAI